MTSGQDINKINSLFTQLQEMVSCDGECLQNREAQKLKQKMENAKTNIITAPNQLQNAVKNYVVFTAGEGAYSELREKQLKEKANQIVENYKQKYDEIIKKINSQMETYEGIFVNFKNVNDLYLKYKEENAELVKKIKTSANDILTNERKTFYQDQQSDVLKFYYYYVLIIIYAICVLCFGIFSLIYPSKIDWKIRLAIYICLNLLPFVSTWFLGIILYIFYFLYNLLPKNVYKEELDEQTNYNYFKNL
jgi:hypothetical protein